MAGVVKKEPKKPAIWQRTMLVTSLRVLFNFISSTLSPKGRN
jgi:hypothetical protein